MNFIMYKTIPKRYVRSSKTSLADCTVLFPVVAALKAGSSIVYISGYLQFILGNRVLRR